MGSSHSGARGCVCFLSCPTKFELENSQTYRHSINGHNYCNKNKGSLLKETQTELTVRVSCLYRYEGNNLVSSGGKKRSHNLPLIIGVVVGGVVFLFIAISVIIMCRNNFINFINRWCGPIPPRPRIRHFEFQEIRRATNNFSEERVIGRGGFGIVYKGHLGDGKFVAVKVLSDASQQGPHEFLNEVLS